MMQLAVHLGIILVMLGSSGALAQPRLGSAPLADILQVLVLDREVLAIDDEGGGQTAERLRIDERVLWKGSRGKVGVVVTDQRVLAIATQSGSWRSVDFKGDESTSDDPQLGERVAIVVTSDRVLGFDGRSGNIVEYRLELSERVQEVSAGGNVAVVVTNRRALGLSPFVGGFFRTPIELRDPIESVSAESNVATVTTERRVLIFRASSGSWEQRARRLH